MLKTFSVLIPDGDTLYALFVAHCFAHFPEIKVHFLSHKHWSPVGFSRYCHTHIVKESELNNDTYIETITEIVANHNIQVFLPNDTEKIAFTIAHSDTLSKFVAIPPLPSPTSFEIANNKWLLAQFLQENKIPVPPTIAVTYNDIFWNKQLPDMKFPVLLKPMIGRGGKGIERFETITDLKYYLEQQNQEKIHNKFIVQSFIPGFHVGANVLCQQGKILATTMQRGVIANEQRYGSPGGWKFIKEDNFSAIIKKLISALNWSGFANMDTIYDPEDNLIKILEINARFWGSLRGSLAAGVSFPYLACLAALDIPFPRPEYKTAFYIHSKSALREYLFKLIGKNQHKILFQETGLKYLAMDPLAELLRVFKQEVAR